MSRIVDKFKDLAQVSELFFADKFLDLHEFRLCNIAQKKKDTFEKKYLASKKIF